MGAQYEIWPPSCALHHSNSAPQGRDSDERSIAGDRFMRQTE
jgi:hypothetical protein